VADEVVVAEEGTLGVQDVATVPSAAVAGINRANEVLEVAAQEIAGADVDIADELPEVHTEAYHFPRNSESAVVGTGALANPPLAIEAAMDAQGCGVDLAEVVCSEASDLGETVKYWDMVRHCSSDGFAESAAVAVVVPTVESDHAVEAQG
jgi:hypothetical protein